jgi:hypothetical protein
LVSQSSSEGVCFFIQIKKKEKMTRKVFQKPIAEVMAEYEPVYPDSRAWADTVAFLLENDSEIIDELQKQFLKQGSFREPVIIKLSDEEDKNRTTKNEVVGYVADGTHRLVSAFLLGTENILVADDYEDFPELEHFVVTKISNSDHSLISVETDELFFDKLRSVCISDDQWITAATGGCDSRSVTIYWDVYDFSLLETINAIVKKKVSSLFPESSFIVETFLEPADL